MRPPTWRARSALVALALIAAACSGSNGNDPPTGHGPGTGPRGCIESTPASDTSLIPADIPLTEYATIVQVGKQRGFIGVASVSEMKIVELFPALSRDLVAERFKILSSDNEGFEAEIFFRRGKHLGSYRMREGPCKDEVTIRLLYRL